MRNFEVRTPGFCSLLLLVLGVGGVAAPLAGQADTARWRIPAGQVASIFGGMSLALVPRIFSINDSLPSCAPCDPETLPGIDRWLVSTEKTGWAIASTVGEVALAAGTWWEMYQRPNGARYVAASFEAAAWTFGVNQVAKAVINRNRPVLYTEDAIEAQENVDSHRSMYSGHTSISFALATSYVLSMSHKKGFGRYWPFLAAAGVAAMRLAAAKHFTTDVLVGAVVGSGTAIVIHEIRF